MSSICSLTASGTFTVMVTRDSFPVPLYTDGAQGVVTLPSSALLVSCNRPGLPSYFRYATWIALAAVGALAVHKSTLDAASARRVGMLGSLSLLVAIKSCQT